MPFGTSDDGVPKLAPARLVFPVQAAVRLESGNIVLRQQLIILSRKSVGKSKARNTGRVLFVWRAMTTSFSSARPAKPTSEPSTAPPLGNDRNKGRGHFREVERKYFRSKIPVLYSGRQRPFSPPMPAENLIGV